METVNCEYLKNGKSCSAILKNEEAISAREVSCENDDNTACCYLCSFYPNCEISCNYLGQNKGKFKKKTDEILVLRCNSCGLKMRGGTRMKIRVGGWTGLWQALPGGALGELTEELLPVIIYVCPKCGRLELVAEEKTKQKIIERS